MKKPKEQTEQVTLALAELGQKILAMTANNELAWEFAFPEADDPHSIEVHLAHFTLMLDLDDDPEDKVPEVADEPWYALHVRDQHGQYVGGLSTGAGGSDETLTELYKAAHVLAVKACTIDRVTSLKNLSAELDGIHTDEMSARS